MQMSDGARGVMELWARRLAAASTTVASVLLAGIFVLINVEVFFRYALNASTLVADEYGGYMFAGIVYLGLNHAIFHDRLIGIDVPGRWHRFAHDPIVRLVVAILTLALNAVLLYAATLTTLASLRFHSRSIQYSKTFLPTRNCSSLSALLWPASYPCC